MSGLKISQRNGRVRIWSSRIKEKLRRLVCPELRFLSLFLSGVPFAGGLGGWTQGGPELLVLPAVGLQVQLSSCCLRQLPQPSCLPCLPHLLVGEANLRFSLDFLDIL